VYFVSILVCVWWDSTIH